MTMVKTGTQIVSESAMFEPDIQPTSEKIAFEAKTKTTCEDTMVVIGTQIAPALITPVV